MFPYFFIKVDRRTLQHAVAADVRTDRFRDSFVVIIPDKGDQLLVGRFLPPAYCDLFIFGIRSEDNLLRTELRDPGSEHFRVLYSDASARNHLCAALESDLEVAILLQSAAEIDNQRCAGRHAFQCPVIDDPSLARAVKVYHMQTADAMIFKHLGNLQGIFVIHFLGVVITLRETNAFAVDHIYSRNQLYHISLQF